MSDATDHLDRIGGRFDLDDLKRKYRRHDAATKPRNALAAIERQILEEVASQSGRYGDHLDAILSEMATLRRQIEHGMASLDASPLGADRARHELNAAIDCYHQLRGQAQQVQYYLIIHREAMGFWNHDDVFRYYPIPAPLSPLPATPTLDTPTPP